MSAVIDDTLLQRRTVRILAGGQVLVSIGFGATVSLGALLAADISGQDSLSGLATATLTLGAAVAAIPLARWATTLGRRFALSLGNGVALLGIALVILAAATRMFPMLLVGTFLIGVGNAGTLQSRFAATDLATPKTRARDLSTVVWSTTVGGVLGPFLVGPGEIIGQAIGMPPMTGAYLFSIVSQSLALVLYLVALRPDPLLHARGREGGLRSAVVGGGVDRPIAARYAIVALAGGHAVMVSIMAMTPVHIKHMVGPENDPATLVGITIGLHVAGMYAFSPVMGIIADRWGRVRVILLGQALLAVAAVMAFALADNSIGIIIALFILGLGWSAGNVGGSALLTEMTAMQMRPRRQGRGDSIMSFAGAIGALGSGLVLAWIGYQGLALTALVIVAVVTVLAPLGTGRRDDLAAKAKVGGSGAVDGGASVDELPEEDAAPAQVK